MTGRGADERECERLREVAAEFVLGTLDGHARAAAVEHLATCARCRDEISSLSGAVTDLALLAPRVQPSPGFTTRVLAAIGTDAAPPAAAVAFAPRPPALARRAWRRRFVAIAGVAAAVLIVVAALLVANRSSSHDKAVAHVAAAMVAPDGQIIGSSTLADGVPGTVHVEVTYPSNWLDYRLEAVDRSGTAVPIGTMHLRGASWQWSGPLPAGELTTLRIVRPDGTVTCEGALPR